jgi:hypothetical protein
MPDLRAPHVVQRPEVLLFNAQKYRTGDEKILVPEPAEDEGSIFEE